MVIWISLCNHDFRDTPFPFFASPLCSRFVHFATHAINSIGGKCDQMENACAHFACVWTSLYWCLTNCMNQAMKFNAFYFELWTINDSNQLMMCVYVRYARALLHRSCSGHLTLYTGCAFTWSAKVVWFAAFCCDAVVISNWFIVVWKNSVVLISQLQFRI